MSDELSNTDWSDDPLFSPNRTTYIERLRQERTRLSIALKLEQQLRDLGPPPAVLAREFYCAHCGTLTRWENAHQLRSHFCRLSIQVDVCSSCWAASLTAVRGGRSFAGLGQ